MPGFRTNRMPRFGLRPAVLHPRSLGQFNPAAYLVPGSSYQFNFTFSVSQSFVGGVIQAGPSVSDLESDLNSWQPFASGTLTVQSLNISGSAMTISVLAGAGSDVLTQGGVEAAIADTLNSAGTFGYTLTVQPGDAPGLATTTYEEQLAQTPTPSLVNSIKALLGQGPALPSAGQASAPWWLYALGIGAAGLLIYTQFS
jgi:hypothetical protein